MKPIFIFSLPRSGSTLLQRILATSGQISTASEPWLLLPLIYTLKPSGVRAEYGHGLSVRAIRDFYEQFPNGRQDYIDELREFALRLYQINSEQSNVYFLDKTPRYHLIINEIFEIFPEGKFIFLWRNPLAVVSSIINSWCNGKWKQNIWQLDLYDGVNNLLNSFIENSSHVHALQYENLVISPDYEMKKLCNYLMIEYNDQMIESFQSIKFDGKWGDHTGIKKYNSLSKRSLQTWQNTYSNPFRRHWAIKYLNWFGEENLKIMGYNHRELISLVSNEKSLNIDTIFYDLFRSALHSSTNLLSIPTERKNHYTDNNATNSTFNKSKY